MIECPRCKGNKRYHIPDKPLNGTVITATEFTAKEIECILCKGVGEIVCPICKGRGTNVYGVPCSRCTRIPKS